MELGRGWACAIICALLLIGGAGKVGAEVLRLGGAGADLETMRMIGQAYQQLHPDVRVEVFQNMGSSGGIKAVRAGALDIGLSGRPLESREQTWGLTAVQYAKVPLVFVVHSSNPQRQITHQQVMDIYTGRYKHWPDGTLVRPLLRSQTDTDTRRLIELLPGLEAAMAKAYMRRGIAISPTDQEHAEVVATTPGAIGYISLSVVLAELRALRPLDFDGVEPTPHALAAAKYPLWKPLYFVVPAQAPPRVRRFLEFVRMPLGREILERTGHMVVTPP